MAAIRPALTDLDFKNLELRAEVGNDVQDLGKDQGVDDVTGNLNNAPGHVTVSFRSILLYRFKIPRQGYFLSEAGSEASAGRFSGTGDDHRLTSL
jgi:hypothetical protein